MVFRRLLIIDRSTLAHNVYATILRPLGFSLFLYQSFAECRKLFNPKLGVDLCLVGENCLGKSADKHLGWLQKKTITIAKPFHPAEFVTMIQKSLKGKKR